MGGKARADDVDTLGKAWAAYRGGDFETAATLSAPLAKSKLKNLDYALYLAGEATFANGDFAGAKPFFQALGKRAGSRFKALAPWRLADCDWELGKIADARRAYAKLLGSPGGDSTVARFRMAEADLKDGKTAAALAAYRKIATDDPSHPLARTSLDRLAAAGAPPLTARERLVRAAELTTGRGWPDALAELAMIGGDEPAEILVRRDYWLGETLFKMRRQYAHAGELLLAVYEKMGPLSAEALFHGARALSRADHDDEAIKWYALVVEKFPSSDFAQEAQFLTGWLEYNRGQFAAAIPGFVGLLAKYPTSKWALDSLWFEGYCHYLLGHYDEALPLLARLAAMSGELEGGKGRYWHARTLIALGKEQDGITELRGLVTRYPLSWYASLARARLHEKGVELGPWGDAVDKDPEKTGPAFGKVDDSLAKDPAIIRVDELIAAGMGVEAGDELERVEKTLIAKWKTARALPLLLDRYTRAGNFSRPFELAEVYGGGAFNHKPVGQAKIWWQYAFPQAYREHVEKYQASGKNPPYYLYSIMRKESGYNPHDVSYADAEGLLQMIPPTTRRVVAKLGLSYTDDLLYDPELNIEVGAWYIGNLAQKFKEQIPLAAGSFNSGPKPVMKWLDKYGDRPIDELVELVSFRETREYMKKVTAIYTRYLMLYDGADYTQPLTVDRAYVKNDLDY
jgi:soluble lytic murein transglycosylase